MSIIYLFQVLTHNLSISVLGQRVGLLVPITYRHLRGKDAPKEEMRRAHLLGWGVELLRASTQVRNLFEVSSEIYCKMF